MRNLILLLLSIAMFTGMSLPTMAQKNKKLKTRIAVFTFEDKTDPSRKWWNYRGQGAGEGMADMLTTELVKSEKYQVIER